MPMYYFNVFGDHVILDTEGVDLPDRESALKEAVRLSGLLLQDASAQVAAGNAWRMDVTDAAGQPVHQIDVRITPALSRSILQLRRTVHTIWSRPILTSTTASPPLGKPTPVMAKSAAT